MFEFGESISIRNRERLISFQCMRMLNHLIQIHTKLKKEHFLLYTFNKTETSVALNMCCQKWGSALDPWINRLIHLPRLLLRLFGSKNKLACVISIYIFNQGDLMDSPIRIIVGRSFFFFFSARNLLRTLHIFRFTLLSKRINFTFHKSVFFFLSSLFLDYMFRMYFQRWPQTVNKVTNTILEAHFITARGNWLLPFVLMRYETEVKSEQVLTVN